ncbi:class I SAM-dependent methyltransferase [Methylobacterium phyllostachyos]|nr:class I SAM-dependent methyltransferase [Methylobacterium phyllostachyos]
MSDDLENQRSVDLATIDLNYDGFRALARNTHLSLHERTGFPDSYRAGQESAILSDIQSKLPALNRQGQVIVDVGPGCAELPRLLIELCRKNGHRLILVDSPEMLTQLPDADHVIKIAGPFPAVADAVRDTAGDVGVDALLCYSVLQYMFVDGNIFDVIDATIDLLAPGGDALFGDVPNASKRLRFFSSPNGQRFHRAFSGRDEDLSVTHYDLDRGRINDAVLAALVQRAQLAGCHGYVLPQAEGLPMANRRDDLLIRQP